MTSSRAIYVDASAIVKLIVAEPETEPLRAYLRRRRPLVSSAISQTEVARAVLALGSGASGRVRQALSGFELMRVSHRILLRAGNLLPIELRSLDAIHLASALELAGELSRMVTYDDRMASAGEQAGITVASPR